MLFRSLNNPLYDRQTFLERGINHLELYFEDGTNPSDEIVRRFIDISDEIIQAGGVVAVHVRIPCLLYHYILISQANSVKLVWGGQALSLALILSGNMDLLRARRSPLCASCVRDA